WWRLSHGDSTRSSRQREPPGGFQSSQATSSLTGRPTAGLLRFGALAHLVRLSTSESLDATLLHHGSPGGPGSDPVATGRLRHLPRPRDRSREVDHVERPLPAVAPDSPCPIAGSFLADVDASPHRPDLGPLRHP